MVPSSRLLLQALAVGIVLGLFTAEAPAQTIHRSRLRPAPRVLAYDPDTDTFHHASSVFTPLRSDLPGGEGAYYGNYLERFHFLGPKEQSGIYGMFEDHLEKLKLDPAHYRYRRW